MIVCIQGFKGNIMATRGKGARVKGASFEREIANKLSLNTGYVFKRGLSQARGGCEQSDVYCEELPVHFELKRQVRPNIVAAYRQAVEDCKGNVKVVITKADREPILVTMNYDEWVCMFDVYCNSFKHLGEAAGEVSRGSLIQYPVDPSDCKCTVADTCTECVDE